MKRRYTAPLDNERCEAGIKHGKTAKEGARCMRRKVKGSDFCSLHQPTKPIVAKVIA